MVNGALNHLRNAIVLLLLLISVGTIGFMLIECWNMTDYLYMVIITITTTGFEEVYPLSGGGELIVDEGNKLIAIGEKITWKD